MDVPEGASGASVWRPWCWTESGVGLKWFLVGGEIFKKTEFNAKFHMVFKTSKQTDQTRMKKSAKNLSKELGYQSKSIFDTNFIEIR